MTQPVRMVFEADTAPAIAGTDAVKKANNALAAQVVKNNEAIGTSTAKMRTHYDTQRDAVAHVTASYRTLGDTAKLTGDTQVQSAATATTAIRDQGRVIREESTRTTNHLAAEHKKQQGLFASLFGGQSRGSEESGIQRGFVSKLTGVGGFLAGPGFVAGAIGGITLDRVIKSTLAAQEANAQLRKSVEASGKSWAVYGGQINDALDRQEKISGFTKTDLVTQFTTMLRVTGSVSAATKDMALAEDVARGRHIALAQAALIVERAHEGNVGALSRLGIAVPKVTTHMDELRNAHIKVTDANRAQVTALTHTAAALDKQQSGIKATAAIEKQYSGDAAARTKTLQGRWDDLRNTLDDYANEIGNKAIPKATALLAWMQKLIDSAKTSKRFHDDLTKAIDDLKGAWHDTVDVIKNYVWPTLSTLGGFLNRHHDLVKAIVGVWLAWKTGMLIGSTVARVQGSLEILETAFGTLKTTIKGTVTETEAIGPAAAASEVEVAASTTAMDAELAGVGTAAAGATTEVEALGTAALALGSTAVIAAIGTAVAALAPLAPFVAALVNDRGTKVVGPVPVGAVPGTQKRVVEQDGKFYLENDPGGRGHGADKVQISRARAEELTGVGGTGSIVSQARRLGVGSGAVYKYGGGHGGLVKPGAVLDCSGYVYQVFTQSGFKNFPSVSSTQWAAMSGTNWTSSVVPTSDIRPGDVVFMVGADPPSPGHVGIIVGGHGADSDVMQYYQTGKQADTIKFGDIGDLVGVKRFFLIKKGADAGGGGTTPGDTAAKAAAGKAHSAAAGTSGGGGGTTAPTRRGDQNFLAQLRAAEAAGLTGGDTSGGKAFLKLSASLDSEQQENANLIFMAAKAAKLSDAQAVEMVAAAYAESRLRTDALNGSSHAFGLFQLLPTYKGKKTEYAIRYGQLIGEGYSPAEANIRAILPDYVSTFRSHPGAAPGTVASLVEKSGQGASFYSTGIGSLFTLGARQPGGHAPRGATGAAVAYTQGGVAAFVQAQSQRLAQIGQGATKVEMRDVETISRLEQSLKKGMSAEDVARLKVNLRAAEKDLRDHVSTQIRTYNAHEAAIKKALNAQKALRDSASIARQKINEFLTGIKPDTINQFPDAIAKVVTKSEHQLENLYRKLGQVKSKDALRSIKYQISQVEKTISDAMSDGADAVATASDRVWTAATTQIQRGFDAKWDKTFQDFDDVTQAGLDSITKETSDKIKNAVATVSGYWGSFQVSASGQTPSEAALAALQSQDQTDTLGNALSDAQDALSRAQKIGDPGQIQAAQRAVTEAQRAIDEAALTTKAKDERTAADDALQALDDQLQAEGDKKAEAYQRDRAGQRQLLQYQRDDAQTALNNQEEDWKKSLDNRKLDWYAFIDDLNKYAKDHGFDVSGVGPGGVTGPGGQTTAPPGTYTAPPVPPGAGSCFLAGTMVRTVGGLRPIEEIKVGDNVFTWDFSEERFVASEVTETFEHLDDPRPVLRIETGSAVVFVTEDHLFWSGSEWVPAAALRVGSPLARMSGDGLAETLVVGTLPLDGTHVVYNLHVEHADHNYLAEGLLAHNVKAAQFFAQGGWAGNPNTSSVDPRDTIRAFLRPGEYVLTPEMIASLGSGNGGGDTIVHVHVAGNVVKERDLALAVRDHLVKIGRSTGGGMFAGQA